MNDSRADDATARRLLVFGGSGAIGDAVCSHALKDGWQVVATHRGTATSDTSPIDWLFYDPFSDGDAALGDQAPFDAVCWAQGANMVDSPRAFDAQAHLDLYRANCLFVMESLAALLRHRLLARGGARLCIVSSIWQERARTGKFSYTVTKAAVGGIVRAASVDLGDDGHLINGVLPGVLDTPMTRANLSPAQIEAVTGKTTAGRLPDLATLADTILFLCSKANRSITGQSITVDLGFSNTCLI